MAQESLIVGLHAVLAALRHEPHNLQGIWVEPQRRDARMQTLLEEAERRRIPVYPQTRAELTRLSGGARHQGVVARRTASPSGFHESELPALLAAARHPALLLVLDGVQDPHNLGACLRSAAAAGVHGVIAPADRAVGLTATVRKVACGAAEMVPFVRVTNLARTLRTLQNQGLWIVGAAGEAKDSLYKIDFTGPTVIVLGAEEKGLRRLTREVCDILARIPITESVESLNVSVAAGIFLFEAVRQRRDKGIVSPTEELS